MKTLLKTLCAAFLPALLLLAGVHSTPGAALFTSNPSPTARGINRVVHIAYRTDGRAGTGTADDPFDGSTTAKFDSLLRSTLGSAHSGTVTTNGLTNVVLRIGPGIFTTGGTRGNGNTNEYFRALGSFVIQGSGKDVTTIKLANSVAGSWTNAYIFYRGTATGRMKHFELSDLSIDLNGANQSLVTGQGTADIGAVQIHAETGVIRDVDVVDIYAKGNETFPIFMGMSARTNNSTTLPANGHYSFERVRAWVRPNGSVTGSMTAIAAGDAGIDSVWRPVSGVIRECQVFGNAEESAFGGFSANGFLLENNWASNTWWGVVFDTYTNKNVRMVGNRFSRIAQTVASANGNDVEGFQFVRNTLDTPDGDGATVFTGDATIDLVYANRIDPAYLLNITTHAALRGFASTNQFTMQGGTNFVIRDGVLLTNAVLNAGTAGAPSASFTGEADTGIYLYGANTVGIASGGTVSLALHNNALEAFRPFLATDGSFTAPSLTFGSDQDTGFYRIGANAVGFTAGGALKAQFDGNGISLAPLTADTLVYANGGGKILSSVTLGTGLTLSSGTLSLVTNGASQVTGSGAGYSLTDTMARVDFGTTDPQVTLPEAGTYRVFALIEVDADPMGDGQLAEAKFYNSSDAADVANSTRSAGNSGGGSYDKIQLTLENIVTVAASKTIQIYARDSNGTAEGSIVSTATSISYIRLY